MSLAEILKQIATLTNLSSGDSELFNDLISVLYKSNPQNPDVVQLMCYLASMDKRNSHLESIIQEFVSDIPQVFIFHAHVQFIIRCQLTFHQ